MKGCNDAAIADLFKLARSPKFRDLEPHFYLSFFEIYSGKVFDLLPKTPGKVLLQLLEDGK
jgi:hypothetical protein